jgi:hypothetical protein
VGNSTGVIGPDERPTTDRVRSALEARQLPSRDAASRHRSMQAAMAAAVMAMRSLRGRSGSRPPVSGV